MPDRQFEPSSDAVRDSGTTTLSDKMCISFSRHAGSLESCSYIARKLQSGLPYGKWALEKRVIVHARSVQNVK